MQSKQLLSILLYVLGILTFAITFRQALRKTSSSKDTHWKEKLASEHELQFVRNKPLDPALLLHIDLEKFPKVDNEKCQEAYLSLVAFGKLPMANLKDRSNYDLKHEYGPQIVELVSNYERHYNQFMQAAIYYAQCLTEYGFDNEAQIVLENCITYHCDLSECYLLLITLYQRQENKLALEQLKTVVQKEMADSPLLQHVLRQFNENLKESV